MLFLLKVVWRRDDFGKCLSISCKNFQHVLEQSEIFYLEKFRHDFMIFSNIGNTGTKIFFKAKMGILNGFSLQKNRCCYRKVFSARNATPTACSYRLSYIAIFIFQVLALQMHRQHAYIRYSYT